MKLTVDLEAVFASNISGESVDLASFSVPDTVLLFINSKVLLALAGLLVLLGFVGQPHAGVLSVHGVIVLLAPYLDGEYMHFFGSNLEFLPGRVWGKQIVKNCSFLVIKEYIL